MNDDEVICFCLGVTAGDIRNAMKDGAKSLEEIMAATQAGTACGTCIDRIENLLNSKSN